MLNNRKNLGLAVTERGITAVEVVVSGQRRTILHSVALPFAGEVDLDHPERLGKELRQVLRQKGLTASRCVIGLAASWIASREKPVPATDGEAVRGALSIAVEREFASGSQELSFDYCTSPSDAGVTALLAAAPRRIVEQVLAMAKAAGLQAAAVTPSAVALATATNNPAPTAGRAMLCLLPHGVELTIQSAGGLRLIRHLPVKMDQPDGPASLSGQLRRVLSLGPPEAAGGRQMLLWDSAGLDRARQDLVLGSLGSEARFCAIQPDMNLGAANGPQVEGSFIQAAALACCADEPPTIDFLHSRLTPAKQRRIGRPLVWGVAAAVLALATAAYFYWDLSTSASEIATLKRQRDGLKVSSLAARSLVDDVRFAQGWYDRRPEFLECLCEISRAFPDEGTIWATNLTITEDPPAVPTGKGDMQAILIGKGASEAAVLSVLDRLKANPRLTNVAHIYTTRQSGQSGANSPVAFSIRVTLRGGN